MNTSEKSKSTAIEHNSPGEDKAPNETHIPPVVEKPKATESAKDVPQVETSKQTEEIPVVADNIYVPLENEPVEKRASTVEVNSSNVNNSEQAVDEVRVENKADDQGKEVHPDDGTRVEGFESATHIKENSKSADPDSEKTHTSPFEAWGNVSTAATNTPTTTEPTNESSCDSEAKNNMTMTDDDIETKEAEAGGSDILPESSTSKLSASLGMFELEFTTLQVEDPEAALNLLLSKPSNPNLEASDPSTSTSTQQDVNATVKQDSLLLKFDRDFLKGGILDSIEENPSVTFRYQAFLSKLHNPLTDTKVLSKVIKFESVLEQFARLVQRKIQTSERLVSQQLAQDKHLAKANKAKLEVGRLKAHPTICPDALLCAERISRWEVEIIELQKKISEETAKKIKLEEEYAASQKEQLEKMAKKGIQQFSASQSAKDEIITLNQKLANLDTELTLLRDHFCDIQKET